MSAVALVQFSTLELPKYLKVGRTALDVNLADSADSAGHEPPLHHMLCVAALQLDNARASKDVSPYLNMFHAGFFIAADDRDWTEVLELAGMPCVMSGVSAGRGASLGMVAGTLLQWREAIFRGCQHTTSTEVREVYNKIFSEFKNIGLESAFRFKAKSLKDNTYLLEYRP
jgi:hypothetical protein